MKKEIKITKGSKYTPRDDDLKFIGNKVFTTRKIRQERIARIKARNDKKFNSNLKKFGKKVGVFILGTSILFFIWGKIIASANVQTENIIGYVNTQTFKTGETLNEVGSPAQIITLNKWQLLILDSYKLNDTAKLDFLAIQTMECNKYYGNCYGWGKKDIGPFQINNLHKLQYNKSKELMEAKRYEALYDYQVQWMIERWNRFENGNCKWEYANRFKKPGETINERRAKCQFILHNGSPRKYFFAELGWVKREYIKNYLFNK